MRFKKGFFSILLTVLFALSIAACGSGGGGGGDDDDDAGGANDATITATDTETQAVTSIVNELTGEATTAAFQGLALEGDTLTDVIKRAITVSSTSSCSEGSVPSCSASSAEISATVNCDGGGSCSMNICGDASGSSGDLEAVFSCSSCTDSETVDSTTYTVVLNGGLGIDIEYSNDGSTGSIGMGTDNFTATISGGSNSGTCSLVMNVDSSWTTSGSSGTVTVDGCTGLCGEYFSISGSETF